jgi:hypothetical protein
MHTDTHSHRHNYSALCYSKRLYFASIFLKETTKTGNLFAYLTLTSSPLHTEILNGKSRYASFFGRKLDSVFMRFRNPSECPIKISVRLSVTTPERLNNISWNLRCRILRKTVDSFQSLFKFYTSKEHFTWKPIRISLPISHVPR